MNKKQTKFSPEVRERAVRLVREQRSEHPSMWAAIETIAPMIGCTAQTLLALAVQANYEWLMHDNTVIHFSGISVFEFTPDKTKIMKMTTFYDTSFLDYISLQYAIMNLSYER